MRKPAPLRWPGLHNLLPVIWRLYFNKLTKLNIQFLNIRAATFAPKCRWFPGTTKPVMAATILLVTNRKLLLEVSLVTASRYKDQIRYKINNLLVFVSEILRSGLLQRIFTWTAMTTSTSVVVMTSWLLRRFNYYFMR